MNSVSLPFCFVVFALVGVSWTLPWRSDGQPGCQTKEELRVVYYPHFYVKSAYWKCVAQSQPGLLQQCPLAYGWLDDAKACVPFAFWYWTPTALPPSQPAAPAVNLR